MEGPSHKSLSGLKLPTEHHLPRSRGVVTEYSENVHHTFPEPCPPDILVPLDVEAVKVVVRQIAAVTTLFEAFDDSQLHAHGDVSREH